MSKVVNITSTHSFQFKFENNPREYNFNIVARSQKEAIETLTNDLENMLHRLSCTSLDVSI